MQLKFGRVGQFLALSLMVCSACRGSRVTDDPTENTPHNPNNSLPGPGPGTGTSKSLSVDAFTGSTCHVLDQNAFSTSSIALTNIFPGQKFYGALAMQQPANDGSIWFVATQSGKIWEVPADPANQANKILRVDLTATIYAKNEAGLLSFALHPDFATNRLVFLTYTTPGDPSNPASIRTTEHLVKFVMPQGNAAPVTGGTELLNQPTGFDYHLGGNLAFGNDGYLYYTVGFGDTANDPAGYAQNLGDWRGKMLRLNVDVADANRNTTYSIPADNPFLNTAGARPEIFASGFRNPWRWSIDLPTGKIWVGDVGQDKTEEVDVLAAGGNYGWPYYEGGAINPNAASPPPNGKFSPPVFSYGHDQGSCVTGGFVYRGSSLSAFAGVYLFSDCLAGHVWALRPNSGNNGYVSSIVAESPAGVVSFAQGNTGELYVINRTGDVLRLDSETPHAGATLPAQLSATGCTVPGDATRLPDKVLAYDVHVPFWSDGAAKERFVSLPPGGRITLKDDGELALPNGTVTIKNFAKNNKRVETRLMMRFDDSTWGGLSYQWNDAGTDATLVPSAGATKVLADGSTWRYPGRSQCLACHNPAAGYALGWQVGQINTTATFADGSQGNQLDALVDGGFFATAPTARASTMVQFPDPNDANNTLKDRAESYLAVNCSFCHQPGGTGLGPGDFRWKTTTPGLGICNVAPTYGSFGVAGATLLTPGDPTHSVLSLRMHASDDTRMPPVSSRVVDTVGLQVLDAWIASLKSCP